MSRYDAADSWEQFPSRLEDACSIADQAGIGRPWSQGVLQIMGSDFWANTCDLDRTEFTRQFKFKTPATVTWPGFDIALIADSVCKPWCRG